jgi:gas vesicle protein
MPAILFFLGAIVGAVVIWFLKPNKVDNSLLEETRQKAFTQAENDFETRKQELIASLSQQYQSEANQKIAETEKALEGQIQDYQNRVAELEATINNLPPVEDQSIDLQNTILELQARINELESGVEISESDDSFRVTQLEQQLQQQAQEFADRQMELQQSFQIQIEQLQGNHQQEIEDYQIQIDNLRNTFANINTPTEEVSLTEEYQVEETPYTENIVDEILESSEEELTPSFDLEEESSSFEDTGLNFVGEEELTPSFDLEEESSSFEDTSLDFVSEEELTPSFDLEEESDVEIFSDGLDLSADNELEEISTSEDDFNFDAFSESASASVESDVEIFSDDLDLSTDDDFNFNLDLADNSNDDNDLDLSAFIDDDSVSNTDFDFDALLEEEADEKLDK